MMRKLTILGLMVVTSAAHAVYTVAPNAYANAQASTAGLNTFIRDVNAPRTGQLLINANQLGAIPNGSQIVGMAFRLFAGATVAFPASSATWADYTVTVGQGLAPLSATTTFATNFVGTPTVVRTGSLTVNAG
jgi:hypothetical protein